jgi:hypothetical protein
LAQAIVAVPLLVLAVSLPLGHLAATKTVLPIAPMTRVETETLAASEAVPPDRQTRNSRQAFSDGNATWGRRPEWTPAVGDCIVRVERDDPGLPARCLAHQADVPETASCGPRGACRLEQRGVSRPVSPEATSPPSHPREVGYGSCRESSRRDRIPSTPIRDIMTRTAAHASAQALPRPNRHRGGSRSMGTSPRGTPIPLTETCPHWIVKLSSHERAATQARTPPHR